MQPPFIISIIRNRHCWKKAPSMPQLISPHTGNNNNNGRRLSGPNGQFQKCRDESICVRNEQVSGNLRAFLAQLLPGLAMLWDIARYNRWPGESCWRSLSVRGSRGDRSRRWKWKGTFFLRCVGVHQKLVTGGNFKERKTGRGVVLISGWLGVFMVWQLTCTFLLKLAGSVYRQRLFL